MEERLRKQKEFILEVDKMKQIYRQTHIRGYERQENDAEHSWHLALMAFLLSEHANEEGERRAGGRQNFRNSSGRSGKTDSSVVGRV